MGRKKSYNGVRAASSSSIEIDFYYEGKRWKERIKLKPTPANLKRVENHRAAILDAIERREFDYATTFPNSNNTKKLAALQQANQKTVADYLTRWLEQKIPTIKFSTQDGYKKIINGVLIPSLGEKALCDLKRPDIRKMCEEMTAGNKRIANILSVLRSSLDDAVGDEEIESNPIKGWNYKKKVAPQEEDNVDPFTIEEQQAILNALPSQGKNLIQFALWTGMRTSELIALQWHDICFQKGEVRVRRAMTQAARNVAETTKTKSGIRTIKLLTPARSALTAQKEFTYLSGKHVFHNPRTNAPWTGDEPIRKTLWQPALRIAEVRYRNPYQTRHTYASMMLSAGEHPMWVATQMGHSDWGMIRRIYGRWMPDASPDAGNKAESLFS